MPSTYSTLLTSRILCSIERAPSSRCVVEQLPSQFLILSHMLADMKCAKTRVSCMGPFKAPSTNQLGFACLVATCAQAQSGAGICKGQLLGHACVRCLPVLSHTIGVSHTGNQHPAPRSSPDIRCKQVNSSALIVGTGGMGSLVDAGHIAQAAQVAKYQLEGV